MKIVIKGDTNDADYATSVSEISESEIEKLAPIIKVLKDRANLLHETKDWNKYRHNWSRSEYSHGWDTPEELYLKTGLLTKAQIRLMDKFIPSNEPGIHTIDSIQIVHESELVFEIGKFTH